MAAAINLDIYSDALVVLATAGVVVPVVRGLGVNPVIGYLAAGALLGPVGLGTFTKALPFLSWFTVTDAGNVAGIADLGIVFLLFLIGLELSFERLNTMRRLVFGLGGLQVIATSAVLAGALAASGQKPAVALVLGACLALSSTAIVIEVLSAKGRMSSGAGRASFAVLLAQDLAVIPVLMFISILAAQSGGSILVTMASALAQAAFAVVSIVLLGRWLLRPLFRLVAGLHSPELFLASILFVIVAAGVMAAAAGLSMALGAFVAGLLLAETEYRKAIEAIVDPFKGLLLGIFFFTVGMNIDIRELLREPLLLVTCVVGLIAIKISLLVPLGRLFRLPWPAAIETGFLLGPGGEFAFVGIGMATTLHLVERDVSSFVLAVTSLTMALIPALGLAGQRLARIAAHATPPKSPDPELAIAPGAERGHAIVIGYGRVGKVVCALLRQHRLPYLATDMDARIVSRDRKAGHNVYFGNGADPAFLRTCGLMDAAAVIITIDTTHGIDNVVRFVRNLRPDIQIVSRARDAAHATHLYETGVTHAVPETVEASLQLSEAVLVGLGVPTGYAIASIHDQRDIFRKELQKAAQARRTPASTPQNSGPQQSGTPGGA